MMEKASMYSGKKSDSSVNDIGGELDIHMQKNECERIHMQKNMQPHFTSMQKSTQDGLNIRSTTGKNIGENKGNAS